MAAPASPRFTPPTSGLTCAPFTTRDWTVLRDLFSDPRTVRWLTRDPSAIDPRAQAERTASRFAECWASDGFGPYALRLGETLVGYAGLKRSRLEEELEIEALWAILPEHQRRGYAYEAMRAILKRDAPRGPNAQRVASWTLAENTASIKLMDKLGFRYERDGEWAGLPHVIYRLGPLR